MTSSTFSPAPTATRRAPRALISAPLEGARDSRAAWIFLGLALLLGGTLHAYPLFKLPFAINDGGLFWAMTRAIAEANFALPARVSYPTASPDIPFCYPPLGFYVAAIFFKLGVPMEAIFRWLPWAWSMGTIWAFWRLARACWRLEDGGDWAAGAATLLWVLLPWSLLWDTMGGGVTRAPGLFFALLATESALGLWRDGQSKKWWPLLFFLALALATHLERARFGTMAVCLVWLFYGRNARGAVQLGGALAGAVLLCAPWWGLCLARFGVEPFLAAAQSGGSGQDSWLQNVWPAVISALGGEPIFPLLHLCGGAGLLWCLWRRQWFVPAWFLLILLVDVRSGRAFVVIPLALSAGILLCQAPRTRVLFAGALTLWLCVLCAMVQHTMSGLSVGDLAAMEWVKHNTPKSARFLIVPHQYWATDAPGEWFPALTARTAVMTVQGAEWLPQDEFRRRYELHKAVQSGRDWHAVAELAAHENLKFDWVWCPDKAPSLQETPSLQPGAGWTKVWSRGENAIWHRTASAPLN